jgi:lipid II:glycine glycyltransferase (peptidoglycan interpeptide bridge formation enzyme)
VRESKEKSMIVREVFPEEKKEFNQVATHPLQSWEWGEFRKVTGQKVVRLGAFDPSRGSEQGKIKVGYQTTIHSLPHLPYKVIYFPKGTMPDKRMLNALTKLGHQEKAIMVKLEPNIGGPIDQDGQENKYQEIKKFLQKSGCQPGRPLFTKYTFQLDLTKDEDQLLKAMKSKTRYNIRLAEKHKIQVIQDNSPSALEVFLKLMRETTKRQGFYAHDDDYYRKMWQVLRPAGIAHLFLAKYQEEVLAAWILFVFNQALYYPYGASTREHREKMASYAMMWQAIKFGQKMGCRTFDLWGIPGPNPDPHDPWYGFYRFKKGFGPQLVEFIGTWDLVINAHLYPPFCLANDLRWKLLRLKARLPF